MDLNMSFSSNPRLEYSINLFHINVFNIEMNNNILIEINLEVCPVCILLNVKMVCQFEQAIRSKERREHKARTSHKARTGRI